MSDNTEKPGIYKVHVKRHKQEHGELLGDYPPEVTAALGFDANGMVTNFLMFRERLRTYLRDDVTEITTKPKTDAGVQYPGVSFLYRHVP